MEYCIKAKPDTEIKDITSTLNSLKNGFGLFYISNIHGSNYYSVISVLDVIDEIIIKEIGKIRGVEKIFAEI